MIAKIPVATPDEAIANTSVWEPPPPEADGLKKYKASAQSKLQKYANLLVAVRDAEKEDPALEMDISVLKYMMAASKGSEKQLHELKAQLISTKEHLNRVRTKVEELLDEEATLRLQVQKLQHSIQQLREAEGAPDDDDDWMMAPLPESDHGVSAASSAQRPWVQEAAAKAAAQAEAKARTAKEKAGDIARRVPPPPPPAAPRAPTQVSHQGLQSPIGARPKSQPEQTSDTVAALTAQIQALQEQMTRTQTGQNFHAYALARVMGIAPPPPSGSSVQEEMAAMSKLPPEQQHQMSVMALGAAAGLAPTLGTAAGLVPGFGAAPQGPPAALGPRALNQAGPSMVGTAQDPYGGTATPIAGQQLPPEQITPPPRRSSASPTPFPTFGTEHLQAKVQAETLKFPDTPKATGGTEDVEEAQRLAIEIDMAQRREAALAERAEELKKGIQEEVAPVDPALLAPTQPMAAEEVIPGPSSLLQHIQGPIDLTSQRPRSPTPPPTQASPLTQAEVTHAAALFPPAWAAAAAGSAAAPPQPAEAATSQPAAPRTRPYEEGPKQEGAEESPHKSPPKKMQCQGYELDDGTQL